VRLAIAVPAHDTVSALFANDLAQMYAETRASGLVCTLAMGVGTFVHQARANLLHDLVGGWGATHVLWLDADMSFPPDTALRLLEHDKNIVAANYMTRVAPSRPTARRDGQCVSSAGATGLEAVDHVGMGVFLMKTEVVRYIPLPHFWYSTPTETEDVYFCRQLRAHGHTIYIDHDLSKHVGHGGTHVYRERAAVTA
jgi:hypothetical protein